MSDISWSQLSRVFGRIGILSFGGPAAQIALMHRELVETRNWLSEDSYLRALSLCMLLPGPEAMQLATYAGWRLRGTAGGLLAGALFVLPGAILIAILALLYAQYGQMPAVQAAFLGIKATVAIVVLQALRKVASKALKGGVGWGLAIASFVGIFALGLPFPVIILLAAIAGAALIDVAPPDQPSAGKPHGSPIRTLVIWSTLWSLPLVLVWWLQDDFLLQLGLFFSKLAVVTFGGAYAVLAYMTQAAVQDYGWITTDQMIDALGLAETTPGPLILVTEFVAFLAGFAQSGTAGALSAGILALWVTFTPCFLWIFLAGPYLDRIGAQARLSAALQGITAAVVGVIANLTLWFALHILFDVVRSPTILALPAPEVSSFNGLSALLMLLAAGLMLGAGRGMVTTMCVMAILSLGVHLIPGI